MSVNNLSPINQKIIEANKEKVSNQQPQVDLSQKPDTVSFSSKKVARNTGIGAILGGIIGGIKGSLKKAAPDKLTQDAQAQIKQGKEKIINNLGNKIADVVSKVKSGAELTTEEKEIAKDFHISPFIKFYTEDLLKRYEQLRDCKQYNGILATLNKIYGSESVIKEKLMRQQYYDVFDGKISIDEFNECFAAWDDEFKTGFLNHKRTQEAFEILKKNGTYSENETPFNYINLRNSIQEKIPEIEKGCEEKYCSKLYQQLEETVKNSVSKVDIKCIAKSAGIGVAIIGGIALVGSLIYKTIHNKKSVQNGQTIQ